MYESLQHGRLSADWVCSIEEDRLVVIRFGRDHDRVRETLRFSHPSLPQANSKQDCMLQDEVLYKIADRVKNFAVIYLCDIDQVGFISFQVALTGPFFNQAAGP